MPRIEGSIIITYKEVLDKDRIERIGVNVFDEQYINLKKEKGKDVFGIKKEHEKRLLRLIKNAPLIFFFVGKRLPDKSTEELIQRLIKESADKVYICFCQCGRNYAVNKDILTPRPKVKFRICGKTTWFDFIKNVIKIKEIVREING